MPWGPDARDSVGEWNKLFSNEALGLVCDENNRYKRARCVPGLLRVMMDREISSAVSELNMSPGMLICHLQSIGWYGRLKFLKRISIAYNNKKMDTGG
jgi:hypothetical protein